MEPSKHLKLKLSRIELLLFVHKPDPLSLSGFLISVSGYPFSYSQTLESSLLHLSHTLHPVHQQILLTLISKIILTKHVLITLVTSLVQALSSLTWMIDVAFFLISLIPHSFLQQFAIQQLEISFKNTSQVISLLCQTPLSFTVTARVCTMPNKDLHYLMSSLISYLTLLPLTFSPQSVSDSSRPFLRPLREGPCPCCFLLLKQKLSLSRLSSNIIFSLSSTLPSYLKL